MSETAVADFLASATANPGMLSRIAAAGADRSPDEAGEAIAALGAQEGFQFSGAEALSVRQHILNKFVNRSEGEDSILDGVRGGTGSSTTGDPYLDQQIDVIGGFIGTAGPTGAGTVFNLAEGAATGNLGGAAVDAANSMNETKDTFQSIISSIFSGW